MGRYIYKGREQQRRRELARAWNLANPERFRANKRASYHRMRADPIRSEAWRKERREYMRCYNMDLTNRLKGALRSRVRAAIKRVGGRTQGTHTVVGISIDGLKQHLEVQFKPGMTWENYGQWEIDHICPLASARGTEEVLTLFHYTNLQPLWQSENRRKGHRQI